MLGLLGRQSLAVQVFFEGVKYRCKQEWAGFVSKHGVLHETKRFKLSLQRNYLHYSDLCFLATLFATWADPPWTVYAP